MRTDLNNIQVTVYHDFINFFKISFKSSAEPVPTYVHKIRMLYVHSECIYINKLYNRLPTREGWERFEKLLYLRGKLAICDAIRKVTVLLINTFHL